MISQPKKISPDRPQTDQSLPASKIDPFTVKASTLLEKPLLKEFLILWGTRIGTQEKELPVAASMFVKRYTSLLFSQGLYDLSVKNIHTDWSLESITLYLGTGWEIELQRLEKRQTPSDKGLLHLFDHNINPLFAALTSFVPHSILWESAHLYLQFFYEKWQQEASNELQKDRLRKDFTKIRTHAFTQNRQPEKRKIPHPTKANQHIELRQTCCLYHRLPGAAYCTNCPRIHKPDCDSGKSLLQKKNMPAKK